MSGSFDHGDHGIIREGIIAAFAYSYILGHFVCLSNWVVDAKKKAPEGADFILSLRLILFYRIEVF